MLGHMLEKLFKLKLRINFMYARKTKRISLNSIVADREFIKMLGKILEEQKEERLEKIKKQLEKASKNQNNNDLSKKSPGNRIRMDSRLYDNMLDIGLIKPIYHYHMDHTYTLNSERESLEFQNYEDIINTMLLPQNINNMLINVRHYDKSRYVDIKITLDNSKRKPCILELSSCSEERMALIEEKIKNLFKQLSTGHSWLYEQFYGVMKYIIPFFMFFSSTMIIIYLLSSYISLSIVISFIFAFFTLDYSKRIVSYLYPYVEFRLGITETTRRDRLRNVFWVIFSILISGVVGSVISGLGVFQILR
jgi:hypothetical protein